MNTKVWYLPYFEGVHHSRMISSIRECPNANGTYGSYDACIVRICKYNSKEIAQRNTVTDIRRQRQTEKTLSELQKDADVEDPIQIS